MLYTSIYTHYVCEERQQPEHEVNVIMKADGELMTLVTHGRSPSEVKQHKKASAMVLKSCLTRPSFTLTSRTVTSGNQKENLGFFQTVNTNCFFLLFQQVTDQVECLQLSAPLPPG